MLDFYPISSLTSDPSNLNPLSPGLFLIGKPSMAASDKYVIDNAFIVGLYFNWSNSSVSFLELMIKVVCFNKKKKTK